MMIRLNLVLMKFSSLLARIYLMESAQNQRRGSPSGNSNLSNLQHSRLSHLSLQVMAQFSLFRSQMFDHLRRNENLQFPQKRTYTLDKDVAFIIYKKNSFHAKGQQRLRMKENILRELNVDKLNGFENRIYNEYKEYTDQMFRQIMASQSLYITFLDYKRSINRMGQIKKYTQKLKRQRQVRSRVESLQIFNENQSSHSSLSGQNMVQNIGDQVQSIMSARNTVSIGIGRSHSTPKRPSIGIGRSHSTPKRPSIGIGRSHSTPKRPSIGIQAQRSRSCKNKISIQVQFSYVPEIIGKKQSQLPRKAVPTNPSSKFTKNNIKIPQKASINERKWKISQPKKINGSIQKCSLRKQNSKLMKQIKQPLRNFSFSQKTPLVIKRNNKKAETSLRKIQIKSIKGETNNKSINNYNHSGKQKQIRKQALDYLYLKNQVPESISTIMTQQQKRLLKFYPNVTRIGLKRFFKQIQSKSQGCFQNKQVIKIIFNDYTLQKETQYIGVYLQPIWLSENRKILQQFDKQLDQSVDILLLSQFSQLPPMIQQLKKVNQKSNQIKQPPSHLSNSLNNSVSTHTMKKISNADSKNHILLGTSSLHGIILAFTKSSFHPILSNICIPRYSHALIHNSEIGFLTGGIEDIGSSFNNVTQQSTLLQGIVSARFHKVNFQNLLNNPAKAFQQYPDMINARYSHSSIEHGNYLYVIGGRQDGRDLNGLLSACQRYELQNGQWKSIPSLQYPRSGSSVITYGRSIYVIGGYTGDNSHSRIIETYTEGDQHWKKVPFLLHQGFEGALIIKHPILQTSVIIFGGKTNTQLSNRVVSINFEQAVVTSYRPMQVNRSYLKGLPVGESLLLIGGGLSSTIQQYNPVFQTTVTKRQLSYLQFCNQKEIKSFAHFQQSINLDKDEVISSRQYISPLSLLNTSESFAFFGHSTQPFAYHIGHKGARAARQSGQSLFHNFYQYTNTIRVNQKQTFVLGGISSDFSNVTPIVYCFNTSNQEINYHNPMIHPRYAFATCLLDNHVYSIGGRKIGEDNTAILANCQRFSLQTLQWQEIRPLNNPRQSPLLVTISKYLLVLGGHKGNGVRCSEMQLYIPTENRWIVLDDKFQLALYSMTPIQFEKNIYLFGGKAENDIQQVYKLVLDFDQKAPIEKCLKVKLQQKGYLSKPGSNLKVISINQKAYIFGLIQHGVEIYCLKTHSLTGGWKIKGFEHLKDKSLKSYTVIY